MDIEFHYYITYLLARRAGFSEDDCYLIAYSSQFVDDNTIIFSVRDGNGPPYGNYISQTEDILKPKRKLMRIYPCFHFVPGEPDLASARRRDGRTHPLNTTPDSANANALFDAALGTEPLDPFRVGIATHGYADTWAHQNFIGYFDKFNGMKDFPANLMPNIGHAEALTRPDIPGLEWNDDRLADGGRTVRNTDRFLEAARRIFGKYAFKARGSGREHEAEQEWPSLEAELRAAIGPVFQGKDKGARRRISSLKTLLGQFTDYDKTAWFKEAVRRHVRGLPDSLNLWLLNALTIFPDRYSVRGEGFRSSRWFLFQEAVKAHQQLAMDRMQTLLTAHDIGT